MLWDPFCWKSSLLQIPPPIHTGIPSILGDRPDILHTLSTSGGGGDFCNGLQKKPIRRQLLSRILYNSEEKCMLERTHHLRHENSSQTRGCGPEAQRPLVSLYWPPSKGHKRGRTHTHTIVDTLDPRLSFIPVLLREEACVGWYLSLSPEICLPLCLLQIKVDIA